MNWNSVILAVGAVSVIGLIAALCLSLASKAFAVPVDEKAEKIREALPGANCGACGFSGCDGYAAALSEGKTENTALCAPGGNEVAKKIAEITGLAAGEVKPTAAVALCRGHTINASTKLEYRGVKNCKTAIQIFGGPKDCVYGCVGFGDCAAVCDYDAISICDGAARINPFRCKACGKCVKACPKGLIEMIPLGERKAAVMCKNHDKGAVTRRECKAGCIGCMKCVKVCEAGAIKVENFCAKVDYDKCVGCGKCEEVCPVGAISVISLGMKA